MQTIRELTIVLMHGRVMSWSAQEGAQPPARLQVECREGGRQGPAAGRHHAAQGPIVQVAAQSGAGGGSKVQARWEGCMRIPLRSISSTSLQVQASLATYRARSRPHWAHISVTCPAASQLTPCQPAQGSLPAAQFAASLRLLASAVDP